MGALRPVGVQSSGGMNDMTSKWMIAASTLSLMGFSACTEVTATLALDDGTTATPISEQQVVAAQQEWGRGIVDISRIHSEGGDFRARAVEHIETLYGYDMGLVMFKPTLAAEDQFRESFDEALSYFIGTEGTEDSGFAIKGWTNVRWTDTQVYTDGDSATAMGNYFFADSDGAETQAEYSFGYVLTEDGELKINLHHSSLPYEPN